VSEAKKLVKATQAAEMLSLSPRKLWELTNCRAIPHLRIGRAVRYAVADLETWIESQKIECRDGALGVREVCSAASKGR
jgi:excisionase family DNA binding protein